MDDDHKYVPDDERFTHIYIRGGSGSGKTTLMLNMVLQDIESWEAVCYIDPHNDPTEKLLERIPKERHGDVVYFEPTEYPIGLNPLAVSFEGARESAVGDLIALFKKISFDSWGPQMDGIFRMSLSALVQIKGATIFDLIPLLTNEAIRQDVANKIRQDEIAEFWRSYGSQFKKDAAQPVLLRLIPFITSPTVKNIFKRSQRFDFGRAMNEGKIVICNLGKCGQDTKQFIGTAFMSVVQSAVMSRARIRESERFPFYLYVDEFQNFRTSAFRELISEGRKFKVGMTLANQIFEDLDKDLRNSIEGNIGETGRIIVCVPGYRAEVYQHRKKESVGTFDLDPLPRVGVPFNPIPPIPDPGDISPLRVPESQVESNTSTARNNAKGADDEIQPSPPPKRRK